MTDRGRRAAAQERLRQAAGAAGDVAKQAARRLRRTDRQPEQPDGDPPKRPKTPERRPPPLPTDVCQRGLKGFYEGLHMPEASGSKLIIGLFYGGAAKWVPHTDQTIRLRQWAGGPGGYNARWRVLGESCTLQLELPSGDVVLETVIHDGGDRLAVAPWQAPVSGPELVFRGLRA